MDLLETECECGNPECKAQVFMRRGYVHISHPDGTEETRWDYLYIDVWSNDELGGSTELMLTPEAAKFLMWQLIFGYMPIISHLRQFILNRPYYWFVEVRHWLRQLAKRVSKRSK